MEVAVVEWGDRRAVVYYDDGRWWFDDGERVYGCRSYGRAMRLLARRAWGKKRGV